MKTKNEDYGLSHLDQEFDSTDKYINSSKLLDLSNQIIFI